MPVKSPLYDSDSYAWSREQAELLHSGKLDKADIDHIAEEIDRMGGTEKRELISRLGVLLLHLLKWRYQPEKQSPSWEANIRVQRNRPPIIWTITRASSPSCPRRSPQPIATQRWRRSRRPGSRARPFRTPLIERTPNNASC
jgi:Domain of unknown function DUF29